MSRATQTVSLDFTPWPHQLPSLRARHNGYKRVLKLWHRRAGKDLSSFMGMVNTAQDEVGLYYHMLPEQAQGRKVVWDAIDNNGKRFLDYIPKVLLDGKPNETEMQILFKKGSIVQVIGADRMSWIGTNPRGVNLSEYQRQDPRAWNYMRPILKANGGWAEFCYTPLGFNHGKKLYDMAAKNPAWFCQKLTVLDTFRPDGQRIVTDQMIEEERLEGMDPDLIQQEYFCSFEGAMQGNYYGDYLKDARAQGRVTLFHHDPNLPVLTAWDIGVGDATAIGWFQRVGQEHHCIDYYEASGKGLEHYARVLQQKSLEKKYLYDHVDGKILCLGPHDMAAREFGSGKTRQEQARGFGLHFRLVPRQNIDDGIAAVRRIFPHCWFHEANCEPLVNALGNYHKRWDEVKRCFSDTPDHDWSSHACDMVRYYALGVREDSTYHPLSKAISAFDPLSEAVLEAASEFNVYEVA